MDHYHELAQQFLRDMVAFPTVNGNEKPLAQYIAGCWRAMASVPSSRILRKTALTSWLSMEALITGLSLPAIWTSFPLVETGRCAIPFI